LEEAGHCGAEKGELDGVWTFGGFGVVAGMDGERFAA
jgi:hypothetical protein